MKLHDLVSMSRQKVFEDRRRLSCYVSGDTYRKIKDLRINANRAMNEGLDAAIKKAGGKRKV
jgi:hypothetical protein